MGDIKNLLRRGTAKGKRAAGIKPDTVAAGKKLDMEMARTNQSIAKLEKEVGLVENEIKKLLKSGEMECARAEAANKKNIQKSIADLKRHKAQLLRFKNALSLEGNAERRSEIFDEISGILENSAILADPAQLEESAIRAQTALEKVETANDNINASLELTASISQQDLEVDEILEEAMAEIEAEGGSVLSEKSTLDA